MANIIPFRALHFNAGKIKDLSRVICPPYDVISASQQKKFEERDTHNFIHVLLRRALAGEDVYGASAEVFRRWQQEEVLVQDDLPAIYFYRHQYQIKRETRIRLGFIALMHLGKSGAAGAHAHEHTRQEAKDDRLKLLRQVKANLSPIFVVFPDPKRVVQRVYQGYVANSRPSFEARDDEQGEHALWRITDPNALALIQSGVEQDRLFIADGHHRFEVARMYRDEMRRNSSSPQESLDYIMAYFTNTESRGLTILPIHRFVKLASAPAIDALHGQLAAYFEIEEVRDKSRFTFLMQKGGRTEHLLGMYAHRRYWLLRLRNVKILDTIMAEKPREYRQLDVSILNALVFKKCMGIDPDNKDTVTFYHDAEELFEKADRDPASLAFFLNPVRIEQMMGVALTGTKMPPKSTFFYPKVASGLLVNKLE